MRGRTKLVTTDYSLAVVLVGKNAPLAAVEAVRAIVGTNVVSVQTDETVSDPVSRRIGAIIGEVPEVDAVFVRLSNGTYSVYSVVAEHSNGVYTKVMDKERQVRARFADIEFDFCLCAHQGRKVSESVPIATHPVFLR